MVRIVYFLFILVIISCDTKKVILSDGKTKVPKSITYFNKYRGEIEKDFFSKVDTLSFYEFKRRYKSKSTNFEEIEPINWDYENNPKEFLKFYGNGCFNYFVFSLDLYKANGSLFDPQKTGERGVFSYNSTEDIAKVTFFKKFSATPASIANYDISFLNIKVKGDTLLVKTNYLEEVNLFVRNSKFKETIKYRPTW